MVSLRNTQNHMKKYIFNNQKIDEQVNLILEECYARATDIINANKDKLIIMAEKLLEKETLDLVDVIECLGDRPFPMEDFMREYLEQISDRKKQEEEKKNAPIEEEKVIEDVKVENKEEKMTTL